MPAVSKCPHCFRSIPEGALRCPHCHGNIVRKVATFVPPQQKRVRGQVNILFVLAAAAGLLLIVALAAFLVVLRPWDRPGQSPPAPTKAGGSAATPTPAASSTLTAAPRGTPFPTPKPPAGFKEAGNAHEGFVLWVPDDWYVYQADLDRPQAWVSSVTARDPNLGEFLRSQSVAAGLNGGATRVLAVNSPAKTTAGEYWPESVAVQRREDLAGRQPEDVLPDLESAVNAAYADYAPQIVSKATLTLKDVPVARIEYTWTIQKGPGSQLVLHGVTLVAFGPAMAYQVQLQCLHSQYRTLAATTYQKVVSSYRLVQPEEQPVLELPAGWHVVRSEANGYEVWVPDDWLEFNRDTGDYTAWSQQVAADYTLGSMYIDAFDSAQAFSRAAYIAVEPKARQSSSVWLATILVNVDPAQAATAPDQIIDQVRQDVALRGQIVKSSRIVHASVRWQNGMTAAYLEYVAPLSFTVEEKAAFYTYEVYFQTERGGVTLLAFSLEDQQADFAATLGTVAASFRIIP